MCQISLFDNQPHKNTKKQSTRSQTDKIWENIKEWNTIEGVELYKPLYKLCSQLFMLTFNKKLSCLNYFIDEEFEEGKFITVMYAEINDTWNLPLKERYKLHKDLISRINNNDTTLEYTTDKIIKEDKLTLFSFL